MALKEVAAWPSLTKNRKLRDVDNCVDSSKP
jgi:hypothetical protein